VDGCAMNLTYRKGGEEEHFSQIEKTRNPQADK